MQIIFLCRFCYAQCQTSPSTSANLRCPSCGRPQGLHLTDTILERNRVEQCAVCRNTDFYVRDEPRKVLGLVYAFLGLLAAYWTYGLSLFLGAFGFYWYVLRYPKITICYHCYAKYRNCRLNPDHKEYDLDLVEKFEQRIRNDRTSRDFKQM